MLPLAMYSPSFFVAAAMYAKTKQPHAILLRYFCAVPYHHQELRRAAASKADMESDAREHANRAKRLQGEVEMMRSEYEVVSEEASGLRGSLAGAEVGLKGIIRL